jgi:hydrogenase assembly chaperone HypC/HupF
MCLALIGKILTIDQHDAEVVVLGTNIRVNIDLIENPQIGDYVLVHSGFAIQKANQDDAATQEKLIYELLEKENNE